MATYQEMEDELKRLRHNYADLVEHLKLMVDGCERGIMSPETCIDEIMRLLANGKHLDQ